MTEHNIYEHRVTPPKTSALAIIALVISLVGILTTFFVPILPQIVAIICGHIARSQVKHSNGTKAGSGMALAALIISYLTLTLSLLGVIFLSVGALWVGFEYLDLFS